MLNIIHIGSHMIKEDICFGTVYLKKKKKSKEIPVFHNIFLLNHTCVVQSLLKIEAGDLLYSYRWLIMAPAKACCLGIIIKTNVLGLD